MGKRSAGGSAVVFGASPRSLARTGYPRDRRQEAGATGMSTEPDNI